MNANSLISFYDSRRLTGPNRHFAECGAVLTVKDGAGIEESIVDAWRAYIACAQAYLHWPLAQMHVLRRSTELTLAFSAPADQLFTATEVNEWAWQRAAGKNDFFHSPAHLSINNQQDALHTLSSLSLKERNTQLDNLRSMAKQHSLPVIVDDEMVSIGEGIGSSTWKIEALPDLHAVPWANLHSIPKALVTGSNGKTTTVRLLAAMGKAQNWCVGYSCTEGVLVNGELVEPTDFSGPAGARKVLRRKEVEAAILETARGGILRRGLAVEQADVAVVTNISDDHFGEYGIHDLEGLAEVKLAVAHVIGNSGMLVLNADDPVLVAKAVFLSCPIAWFSLSDRHPILESCRLRGGSTCGVDQGELVLAHQGHRYKLGKIAAMPLSMQGHARYNVANLAAAALAALGLGIEIPNITQVLLSFGKHRADNPGRLQYWNLGGIHVFMDYAHNPDGLRGFLQITHNMRGNGRMALVLGQAGNRNDAEICALARTAAAFQPDLVVLKDIAGFMRGRQSGEVARILHAELLRSGVAEDRIRTVLVEMEAARTALAWAKPSDVLALPIHAVSAQRELVDLLDRLEHDNWSPDQGTHADFRLAEPVKQ